MILNSFQKCQTTQVADIDNVLISIRTTFPCIYGRNRISSNQDQSYFNQFYAFQVEFGIQTFF